MRETKFRGYRNYEGNALYPPDKRWIYGYYYFQDGKHWIKDANDMRMTYVVEEESVGQYIGLRDPNGAEIYEEDILASYDRYGKVEMLVVVEWIETEARYTMWYPRERFRVIGNRSENPELLEASR